MHIMRRVLNKSKVVLIGAVSIGLLCACADKEPEPEIIEEPEEIVVEVTPEVEEEPSGPVSLLTNEMTDTDVSNMRPLAVMIENTKVALPHYGLADAGIIYEIPAEGGITRYMAFYDEYEDFERLGNVRSTRPYYIYVASEYDAILAHFGQSAEAKSILNTHAVDDIDGMTSSVGFYRTSDKKQPHNAYLSGEGILKEIENHSYNRYYEGEGNGHFKFAKDENLLLQGSDATKISVYYQNNKPWFEYDAVTGLYTRYAYGALEPDANRDDNKITVSNIIFQDVDSSIKDSEGHLSVTLTGSGTGKFFTRGKVVDINWKKDSLTDRTIYTMENGEEIELNTGKTFICLVENAQKGSNKIEPALDSGE